MFVEKELKLSAGDDFELEALLAALGAVAQVRELGLRTMRDTYMDTRSRSLARAGLSARHRRVGRKASLQVKPVLLIPELVLQRVELGTPLRRGEDPGRALRRLVQGELPITLRGVPRPEVELRSRRRVYHVEHPAGCVAELSVDQSTALRPGTRRGQTFYEVELELQGEDGPGFDALVEAVRAVPGLSPAGISKHRRALGLLELPVYQPKAGVPPFTVLTPSDVAARLVCRTHWRNVRSYEPGTRVGLDLEYLHKMRVSTRRLRAALTTFACCFDARTLDYLQRNLRWLAAVLGEVRDLDVQLYQLEERRRLLGPEPAAGWQTLRGVLQGRWEQARQRLLVALDSPRYQRLCQRAPEAFSPAPRRRNGHPGRRPVALLAEELVGKRVRQVRKAAKRCTRAADPEPEKVHALRIRGKKLRYAAEAFAGLYGEEFKARIKGLAGFQDVLGLFNDNIVNGELAVDLLQEALGAEGGAPGEYLYVLGQLQGAAVVGAGAAKAEVADAFAAAGGQKAVRALARETARGARRAEELALRRQRSLERRAASAEADPEAPAEGEEESR